MENHLKYRPKGPRIVNREDIIKYYADNEGRHRVIVENVNYPIIDVFLTNKLNEVNLETQTNIGDSSITVSTGHNFSIGEMIELWDNGRFAQQHITTVSGNNIGLEMPIDYSFSTDSKAYRCTNDMTTVSGENYSIFSFKPEYGIWGINKIMAVIEHTYEGDGSVFGDQETLTNGIIHKVTSDNCTYNLWNIKNTNDLRVRSYNNKVDNKICNGVYTSTWQKSFSGQENNNSSFLLEATNNTAFEVIVRDNLSQLVGCKFIIQGSKLIDNTYYP